MVRQAGCRDAPALVARPLDLLPADACRWVIDESDASACARPDAAAADWLGRPVADAGKSAAPAPDDRELDAQWPPLGLQARPVSVAPCTPDAARFGERSFAAAAPAVAWVRLAQLAWSPSSAAVLEAQWSAANSRWAPRSSFALLAEPPAKPVATPQEGLEPPELRTEAEPGLPEP
jgi:hypothetical protein